MSHVILSYRRSNQNYFPGNMHYGTDILPGFSHLVCCLVERIRLVAFDFDMTLVNIHTGGRWRGSVSELQEHLRPEFLCLIRQCHERGIHVAIATFSSQNALLRDVLQGSLIRQTNSDNYDIPVYGVNDRVAPHLHGKQNQLILARNYFNEMKEDGEMDMLLSEIVLVDDDERNIEIARRDNYRIILYDPENSEAEDALVLTNERRHLRYYDRGIK